VEEAPQAAPQEVVRVLSALSDVNRYRIVDLLANGDAELTCGAICAALQLSPSLVSHHLSVLEEAGLLDRRKNGLWTLNSLRREELARRLSCLHAMTRAHPLNGDESPN
jgi:ArsR family transcriptional regulator